MKKLVSIIPLLLLGFMLNAQDVPATVSYCDIKIRLTGDAQTRIQEYYRQIVASPRYFNEMVKRAELYMPFIEEAFQDVGVPEDLKYLAIQESALRADVVSSSKAVGFWQMKEGTASDLSLQVDGEVDERMHIYRSSYGAASYLKKANKGYSNWIYAVLSYYEGPTGSVPYTNPDFYGEKSMQLSAKDHWYVLKAIANKLAYQKALQSNDRPALYLMPFLGKAGTPVKTLLAQHQLDEEDFFRYNKWIRNKKRIPRKKDYTYYIPKGGNTYIGHIPDPGKNTAPEGQKLEDLLAQAPRVGDLNDLEVSKQPAEFIHPAVNKKKASTEVLPTSQKEAVSSSTDSPLATNPSIVFAPKALDPYSQTTLAYVEFQLNHDLHYGAEYIEYTGYTRVAEIADRYKKSLADFLMYNELVPGKEPQKGKIIYIDRPERRNFHIVEEGESLTDIAADHMSSVLRIQNRNRMTPNDLKIYVGQKLYLKDRKPKNEKVIILVHKLEDGEKQEQPKEEVQELAEANTEKSIPSSQVPEMMKEAQAESLTVYQEETADIQAQETPPKNISEELEYLRPNAPTVDKPVWVEHIVAAGETLWQISQKYGTQVDLIKKINKLESDEIIMGQSLRLLATKKF
ncbi:MAG: LysM peptidoglycan-binding domain-containing protein [Bacteroidota bacterium]